MKGDTLSSVKGGLALAGKSLRRKNTKTAGCDENMKYQGVLPENHRSTDGFQEERPDISCFYQNHLVCFVFGEDFSRPERLSSSLYGR